MRFVNSDSNDARTLVTEINVSDSEGGVTVEKCVDGCGRGGYSHAGVEFANECCMCRLFVELSYPEYISLLKGVAVASVQAERR